MSSSCTESPLQAAQNGAHKLIARVPWPGTPQAAAGAKSGGFIFFTESSSIRVRMTARQSGYCKRWPPIYDIRAEVHHGASVLWEAGCSRSSIALVKLSLPR